MPDIPSSPPSRRGDSQQQPPEFSDIEDNESEVNPMLEEDENDMGEDLFDENMSS